MNIERYRELIDMFREKRILVLGDVMLDRFLWGTVSRISPEAPVPVVRVRKESIYPGGAANVARNLIPFAKEAHMIGIIGEDDNGATLMKTLEEGGIRTDGMLRDQGFETITKTRVIARQQHVIRFDHESPGKLSQEQRDQVATFLTSQTALIDGLIIEDYGKGFISQELVDAVIPIAQQAGLVVTVDPNPGNPLVWQGVTAVKPNRFEAFQLVGISAEAGEEHAAQEPARDPVLRKVGEKLLELWGTKVVQITLGELGMMLFERGEEPHHIPTKAKSVFDVSGAGDTAIALFTLALTAGATPVEAAEISNFASGVVVGKLGTATLSVEELLESMQEG